MNPPDAASRPAATQRVSDGALLDAAMACVLAVGVRRTTLTDVARRAGVSRMTVYRRFPDVQSLVAALMTREFGAMLVKSADATAGEGELSARAKLVSASVHAVRLLAENPLLCVVLRLDSDLLLPYLVERIGGTQRIAEQFIAEQITAGHRDGSVRTGLPTAQSRAFFLTVQATVISLRPATVDLDRDALLTELASQLDGALRPTGNPYRTEETRPAPELSQTEEPSHTKESP